MLYYGVAYAIFLCREGLALSFAEFIKEVRSSLNLSQKQLAQALNVNYTTINRWENGHVVPSNLALKSFYDLCENNFIMIPVELRNGTDK